ncbi:MAG TPA: cysteine-rich CWC family protein [Hyphomicrobiaceae bacterium]|nr:cysteine-rich CWC family protein [Hyphomicrobiaceae bacterium]
MARRRAGEGRTVHACPSCGGAVECGMANGDETCWCFELPHALPVSGSDAQCFCKACLERLIDPRKVVAGETDQGSG